VTALDVERVVRFGEVRRVHVAVRSTTARTRVTAKGQTRRPVYAAGRTGFRLRRPLRVTTSTTRCGLTDSANPVDLDGGPAADASHCIDNLYHETSGTLSSRGCR